MAERLGLKEFGRRVVAGFFPEFLSLADAFESMRFVQADPIRSPARAQDLVLRQRVSGYVAGDLEEKFPSLGLEEGYLFAYGFMTPEVWRHLRFRSGSTLKKRERAVLEAVDEMGEAHPRDLGEKYGRKTVRNYWGGKSQEVKQHLDKLHHHGYLRVSRRENGIRVYQVPKDSKRKTADPFERYCFLALTTALVFGPTTRRFLMSELRSHNHLLPARGDRLAAVENLVETGKLAEVTVAGVTYLWVRQNWMSTDVPERVRILAPFDPLVRDRERFLQLWGWEYRFEAYVPKAKRERGYYTMPLLWRDNVLGWANAKVEHERLLVELGFVGKQPRGKAFRSLLEVEVEALARFLGLASGAWELT
ncbi:DNA glycosylase AlkZ-like family protein [Aeoliella sp.]|uniref:DNA glycosylase AlkZ-like family protein n=1 Tax=Aeoliella sp. TaxID=2795800 RepID=UPI003CCB8F4B